MSEVADQLRAAKALITNPLHWCTDTGARSANGIWVAVKDPRAVQWCAGGAARRVGADTDFLYQAAHQLFSKEYYSQVNDQLGHAAVMQMYDRAIELAEALLMTAHAPLLRCAFCGSIDDVRFSPPVCRACRKKDREKPAPRNDAGEWPQADAWYAMRGT